MNINEMLTYFSFQEIIQGLDLEQSHQLQHCLMRDPRMMFNLLSSSPGDPTASPCPGSASLVFLPEMQIPSNMKHLETEE